MFPALACVQRPGPVEEGDQAGAGGEDLSCRGHQLDPPTPRPPLPGGQLGHHSLLTLLLHDHHSLTLQYVEGLGNQTSERLGLYFLVILNSNLNI